MTHQAIIMRTRRCSFNLAEAISFPQIPVVNWKNYGQHFWISVILIIHKVWFSHNNMLYNKRALWLLPYVSYVFCVCKIYLLDTRRACVYLIQIESPVLRFISEACKKMKGLIHAYCHMQPHQVLSFLKFNSHLKYISYCPQMYAVHATWNVIFCYL